MFLNKRTIYYTGMGILFVLIFHKFMGPYLSFALYNIGLAVIIFLDFFLTPGKDNLKITRSVEDKLWLGAKNEVKIKVKNLTPRKYSLEFKDEYPVDFEIDKRRISLKVDGFSESSASYNLISTRRGKYRFGSIHVRVHGVLGLAGRQMIVESEKSVKVYPNIREISSYKMLARKGHLLEAGLKPSRVYGVGTDFEYLREYVPDDEYRKINWKATARRFRLVTSQFQIERSQNIMVVIEAGRMMTSRIDKMSKMDHAINASVLLGYVAMEKGDNVGLMLFSSDIKTYIPPGRGKKQLNHIIEALYNQEAEMVEPDYKKAFKYLLLKNKKRSLVVIFTDLIDVEVSRAVVVYSRALYPVHLPLCVAVSDPGLEAEAEKYPDTISSLYQKAVAEDLIHQRMQVKSVLERGGVLTLDVSPDQLTPALIRRYLSIKARNKL